MTYTLATFGVEVVNIFKGEIDTKSKIEMSTLLKDLPNFSSHRDEIISKLETKFGIHIPVNLVLTEDSSISTIGFIVWDIIQKKMSNSTE